MSAKGAGTPGSRRPAASTCPPSNPPSTRDDADDDVAVAVDVRGLIDRLLDDVPVLQRARSTSGPLLPGKCDAARVELVLHRLLLAEAVDETEIDRRDRTRVSAESITVAGFALLSIAGLDPAPTIV